MYVHVLTDLFRCRYPRVGAEGRDAVIDVLIKVIPKNKLAVELFVKVGGTYSIYKMAQLSFNFRSYKKIIGLATLWFMSYNLLNLALNVLH